MMRHQTMIHAAIFDAPAGTLSRRLVRSCRPGSKHGGAGVATQVEARQSRGPQTAVRATLRDGIVPVHDGGTCRPAA